MSDLLEFDLYPKCPSYLVSKNGSVFSTKTNKIIKAHSNSRSGYMYVMIMDNGKKKNVALHRMVYESHVGEISEGMTIDHIDGNKLNNSYSNLEQVSFRENIERSIYTQKTHHSIDQKPFDDCKILSIITLYSSGFSVRKIQSMFPDNKKTISGIISEKNLYLKYKGVVNEAKERSRKVFGYNKKSVYRFEE